MLLVSSTVAEYALQKVVVMHEEAHDEIRVLNSGERGFGNNLYAERGIRTNRGT